ncbi:hypothetical protein DB30_02859 [Enhygromyxa salina]|uniref:Uncharacterized protein n=1 Tax=Enhygromyxa salina TaxID=215803 RepID=A0A0C1ZLP1_9BACT|nr:hypothetical protein DB30_02859 [Enhygromyxa salina]
MQQPISGRLAILAQRRILASRWRSSDSDATPLARPKLSQASQSAGRSSVWLRRPHRRPEDRLLYQFVETHWPMLGI